MQDSLTPAQRAVRRMKAGRRPALPGSLSILEAVRRLVMEADRARNAMLAETMDPEDVHMGMLFSVSARTQGGLDESIGAKWLGEPGRVGEFIGGLEKLAEHSSLMPIGIVWAVLDRQANKGITWAKPLVAGQEDRLKLAEGLFRSPHRVS